MSVLVIQNNNISFSSIQVTIIIIYENVELRLPTKFDIFINETYETVKLKTQQWNTSTASIQLHPCIMPLLNL